MGIEIFEIENPNLSVTICDPELHIAGFISGVKNITSIIEISNGYISKDKIVTIEMEESLLVNGSYNFNIQKDYEFLSSFKNYTFYIENVFESSGKTRIKVYGSKINLESFFGDLVAKNLDNFSINFFESLQDPNSKNCVNKGFEVTNIKNDRFKIKVLDNPKNIKNFYFRYKKENEDWTTIKTVDSSLEILNLDSNSNYYITYCKECITRNSLYSTKLKIKTL